MPRLRSLLLVPALVAISLLPAGCGRSPLADDPGAAATAFFANVSRGDTKGAYDSAAFSFQAAQTPEAFRANCLELNLVGSMPPVWTQTGAGGNASDAGSKATVSGIVTNSVQRALNISATLQRDGGAWKVCALQLPLRDSERNAGNPFTLVGKGADFRDVYHQPMPPPAQIAALAQETMAKFAAAVLHNDFETFYNYVALGWRNGTLATSEDDRNRIARAQQNTDLVADNRITVPLLENNFGSFVEKKVDLTQVARTQPLFDRPPQIGSDGYLTLLGHFQDEKYRANFHFKYAYELPRWKLCEIDVSVLKP